MHQRSSSSSLNDLAPILYGLFVVGVILAILYWFFSASIDKLNTINSDLGKAIVSGAIAITVAAITVTFGKAWEHRNKRKQEIYAKKTPVYEDQIKVIFSVFFASKAGKPELTSEQLVEGFMGFTEKLMIWGGPKVIKAWQEFRTFPHGGSSPVAGLEKFADFMLALREDVGNSNNGISRTDLLKLFVNDYEEGSQSKDRPEEDQPISDE